MSDNKDQNTTEDTTQEPQEEETVVEEVTENIPEETKEEEIVEERSEENEVVEGKNTELPNFRAGDMVKVFYRIIEGAKTRIQPYEGIVIARKGKDISKTFTVRRIGADKIGVERIFPLYSPNIEKIEVTKRGKVRRSKLYYLRDKVGKAAMKVKELGK